MLSILDHSSASYMSMVWMKLCSWYVWGLGDHLKSVAVFTTASTLRASILCLQVMHLTKDTCNDMKLHCFPSQFHSVHTSYLLLRGVSILIGYTVLFPCKQSSIDDNGRYHFLYCVLKYTSCILTNVYVPTPFNVNVLKYLLHSIADKPGVPVVSVGDFNMILNIHLDRFVLDFGTVQDSFTSLYYLSMEA